MGMQGWISRQNVYVYTYILHTWQTYHSLDKVQVFGHHVMEVISYKDSSDKELEQKFDGQKIPACFGNLQQHYHVLFIVP